jgi:serine/threonine protein kinase/Tol biopolymer transport system component
MPLEAGARFGPFEIVSPAGAGGMGEVYRARDTRLDRTVAIKVLPPDLTSDPAARQRFEREARAVAALSHAHICTLHDIGQQDGTDFLVLEYLEGQTLAARLTRGKLPLDQALQYGIQIADALAAAHRAGIIHRDLKPGNVMITRAGAKLLDFGLAKPRTQAIVSGQTVTSAEPLTSKGMVLGTLQYMAPEQLEGKEADARSDIFAFGAVLYEMATGQRALTGPSHVGLIAATRDRDPAPVSGLRPVLPAGLDHAVQKCLASDPEHRWQHAADLRDELQWIAQQGLQERLPVQIDRRWKYIALLSAALASMLLAVLVGLATVHFREQRPSQSRVAFTVQRPLNTTFPLLNMPVLSPDGTRLLFVAPGQGGKLILWNRALESLAPQPLAGTEISSGPPLPFWSPDGRSIGFFADGKLKTIAASGGAAQTLAAAPDGWGGSWGPDGTIIFSSRTRPLYRVSAAGGPATVLRELDASRREVGQAWPCFLPDGKHYLYVARSTDADKAGIYLGTVGAQESRLLIRGESNVAYSPPGFLIFVRDGTLLAQAFDLGSLQLANEAVPLPAHGGETAPALGSAYGLFSVSGNGILAYAAGGYANAQPTWYDRTGKVLGAIGEPAEYGTVTLSPDDKRVALERTGAAAGVWLLELATGIPTRLTFNGSESDPIWSPEGRELVFTDYRAGNLHRRVIGNSEDKLLPYSEGSYYAQEWAPDGGSILIINQDGRSLYRLPLSGARKPELLLETSFAKDQFHVSPDGRWIAYNSLESGRWEVYVAAFPSFADKRQVSRGGGGQPQWRKDGKELFYLALDGNLMAVRTTSGAAFNAGVPASLFRAPIRVDPVIDQYGVARDGQRFIFAPFDSAVPITVLVNWAAGLKPSQTAGRAAQ